MITIAEIYKLMNVPYKEVDRDLVNIDKFYVQVESISAWMDTAQKMYNRTKLHRVKRFKPIPQEYYDMVANNEHESI